MNIMSKFYDVQEELNEKFYEALLGAYSFGLFGPEPQPYSQASSAGNGSDGGGEGKCLWPWR